MKFFCKNIPSAVWVWCFLFFPFPKYEKNNCMTFRSFEFSGFATSQEPAKKDALDGLWKELLQKGEKKRLARFCSCK